MPDSFFLSFFNQKHPQNPAKKLIKVSQKTKFDLKNEKKDRYILVCHIFFSTMSAQRSTYLPSFVCSEPIYGSCPSWNKIQAYQQRSPTNRQSTTYSQSPNRIRYLLNLCLQSSLFRTFHIHTHCRSGKPSTNLDRSDPLTQLHGSRIILGILSCPSPCIR